MYHITFYPSEDKKKSHIDYSAVLIMFFKVEKKEVDYAVFKIKSNLCGIIFYTTFTAYAYT